MRIDMTHARTQDELKVTPEKGDFSDSLKEGQRITAHVVSVENGGVTLKTAEGHVFSAILESDFVTAVGQEVLLEFTGKEEGSLLFNVVWDQPAQIMKLVRDFDDKSLVAMAAKLSSLNLPVNETTARLMSELMQDYPQMTADEAAFLASNKLTGDETLIKAALNLLSNDAKADVMIKNLLSLLETPEEASRTQQMNTSETVNQSGADFAANKLPQASIAAPISDWLEQIAEGEAAGKSIIAQTEGSLQSGNIQNFVEKLQNGDSALPQQDLQQLIGRPESAASQRVSQAVSIETASAHSAQAEEAPVGNTAESSTAAKNPLMNSPQETNKIISEVLSEIPEFRGTPPAALERFSAMIMKIAGEGADISAGDTEKLKELLQKLFTGIEKNDKSAGERLKSAKEELFARIAMIEEAIIRAAPPARTQMLEQTRALMDHVRLLNNIGQFIYMQMPVKIGDENKSAELYLFRRKGRKKQDSENVNILLALELENMGRFEALLNIKNKDISIQMETSGPEEKEFFLSNTVLLHDLLEEAGFKLVNASITCAQKETTPLTALCALGRYTQGKGGGIDFRI